MLARIALNNYNCFVGFEIRLPRRLLLVGSNGSGKTSLWEAIAALQDFLVRGSDVADVFPTRSRTRWLRDNTQSFSIDVSQGDKTYTYTLEIQHDLVRRTAAIELEKLSLGDRPLYENRAGEVRLYGDELRIDGMPRTVFPFGRRRSFLADVEPRPDNTHVTAFREAVADFWLMKPSPRIEPTTAEEGGWLERDGRNFPSWFRGVLADKPEIGTLLNEALRPSMPGLRRIYFEKISQKVRELVLESQVDGREFPISVSELSDGQRSLMLLHGLLLGAYEHAGLAFLDEPDLGLAPHEIQPWLAQAVNALDNHDGQLFVISHHPAVIDYLAPDMTLRFWRPSGGRTRIDEITLETTGGTRVSEWLSRSWAYEDEHEEESET